MHQRGHRIVPVPVLAIDRDPVRGSDPDTAERVDQTGRAVGLAAGQPLLARVEPLHRVAVPNNITMGGDELVLYSTPWTRHPLAAAP